MLPERLAAVGRDCPTEPRLAFERIEVAVEEDLMPALVA
jgi:hypothetical protein